MSTQRESSQILSVISQKIAQSTKSGARIDVNYGQVSASDYLAASVYLAGDTSVASPDFRIPAGLVVNSGDYVRVSIDPRGHRWIDEVIVPTTFPKMAINPSRGQLLGGDGTVAPSPKVTPDADGVDIAGKVDVGSLTSSGNISVGAQLSGATGVLPYAMWAGNVSITVASGASSGNTAVSFTSGRFTQAPVVFVTQSTIPGGSTKFVVKTTAPSTTGVTVYAYTGDGTTVASNITIQVSVVAIQMTSASGTG